MYIYICVYGDFFFARLKSVSGSFFNCRFGLPVVPIIEIRRDFFGCVFFSVMTQGLAVDTGKTCIFVEHFRDRFYIPKRQESKAKNHTHAYSCRKNRTPPPLFFTLYILYLCKYCVQAMCRSLFADYMRACVRAVCVALRIPMKLSLAWSSLPFLYSRAVPSRARFRLICLRENGPTHGAAVHTAHTKHRASDSITVFARAYRSS
jgi:hypothetical protein